MINTYFISSFITVGVLSLGTGLFLKFKKRYTGISVILMIVLSLFSVMIFPFVYTKINLALSFLITFIVIGIVSVPLAFKETAKSKEYEQSDKELADFKKFIKNSSFTAKNTQLNSTISSHKPIKSKEMYAPVSSKVLSQDDNIKNLENAKDTYDSFNNQKIDKDLKNTSTSYDNFKEELEQELFNDNADNKNLESTQDTYDNLNNQKIDKDLKNTSSSYDNFKEELEQELFNHNADDKSLESTQDTYDNLNNQKIDKDLKNTSSSYDNFKEELEQELFNHNADDKSLESTQDTYDNSDEDLKGTSDNYNNFDKQINWDKIGYDSNVLNTSQDISLDSDIKKNVNLGIYYKNNNMLETAIEYFKMALDKKPDKKLYFWLVVELTKLYRDTGDKKSATEMLSNYLISNKSNITSEETDKIEILANSLLEDSKK